MPTSDGFSFLFARLRAALHGTTIAAAGLAAALSSGAAVADDRPVLTVLTYDSFNTEWGPGPAITPAFEALCGCELRLVAGGDGASLLARLRLEGRRTKIDVVLGLDAAQIAEAGATGLFAPHGPARTDLPAAWENETFIPYDWGYLAFVYDRTRVPAPPASFRELAASDLRIVIEDPRSSSPGLGLVMWVKDVYGDGAGALWRDLAHNIVTVTKGWTEAYNLFLAGEADMVLSYTTSPAYHLIAEGDDTKAAAPFDEGHYLQVEVAAKVASSANAALADQFLDFMLGPEFQAAIPETNWMYPARTPEGGLPEGFDSLIVPDRALFLDPERAAMIRDAAVDEWRDALSR